MSAPFAAAGGVHELEQPRNRLCLVHAVGDSHADEGRHALFGQADVAACKLGERVRGDAPLAGDLFTVHNPLAIAQLTEPGVEFDEELKRALLQAVLEHPGGRLNRRRHHIPSLSASSEASNTIAQLRKVSAQLDELSDNACNGFATEVEMCRLRQDEPAPWRMKR